jgi:hypothetical protein
MAGHRIALFLDHDDPPEFGRVLEALLEGLRREGEIAVLIRRDRDHAHIYDAAGFYNWSRPKHDWRRRIIARHHALGRPVLAVNHGYLRRGRAYSLGWNGINGRADFCNKVDAAERFEATGIEVAPWKSESAAGHVLVCGQTPGDPSLYGADATLWAEKTIAYLGRLTARPLVWRPHPNVGRAAPSMPGARTSLARLDEDLAGAHAVVTYSSSTSAMAAIQGVPIFAASDASIAWPVANREIEDVENPATPDRAGWLRRLAYAEWTLDEIAAGLPWRRLAKRLEDVSRETI